MSSIYEEWNTGIKPLSITKEQARRFLLAHQKLWPPCSLKGKDGVLGFIGHAGCIQFDPLDIVGRNAELVLQARVADFRRSMLEELLYRERRLLDGFDKMMAIYLTEDWPYFHYRRREEAERSPRPDADLVKETSAQVLKAIEEKGPLSSLDFDHDQKVAWPWGPTRLAKVCLETLYHQGELVVHHKVHTRKVYDLARRHIPKAVLSLPNPHPAEEDYFDWHILRRIGGIGLQGNTGGFWHGIHGATKEKRGKSLERLAGQGKIIEVLVEGVKEPLYMRNDDMAAMETAMGPDMPSPRAAVIAPLDNLLWDRDLIAGIFGFNYRWEVYKPVKERQYGYYVLPVLYGDRFIARFEPGRDKKTGALVIVHWWWEKGVTPTAEMRAALKDCFIDFLDYLGGKNLKVKKALVNREGLGWLPG